MRKYLLQSYFLVDEFEEHNNIKQLLLDAIKNSKQESLTFENSSDQINKLDWSEKYNFDREWVQILYPKLFCKLTSMAKAIGFENAKINELWFQQYIENDIHSWHGHGSNFTCVYYLEMDDDAPKTELIEPFSMDGKFTPEVKEGSIIVFPSYVVHRAPIVKHDTRKTIIAFNIDFEGITEEAKILYDSL